MGAGSKPASTNAATGMIGNPTRGWSQTFCWNEHLYASARAANGLEPVSFSLLSSILLPPSPLPGRVKTLKSSS